jgi:ribonucleoside-triphosphate reductase
VTFSFKLTDSFIAEYAHRPVPWGYQDAAGNSVGEITFLRTYSRLKDDGRKETWVDTCRRVIEGMFSIQKDHAKTNRLPWNNRKAQVTAQDAFERLFTFKWSASRPWPVDDGHATGDGSPQQCGASELCLCVHE